MTSMLYDRSGSVADLVRATCGATTSSSSGSVCGNIFRGTIAGADDAEGVDDDDDNDDDDAADEEEAVEEVSMADEDEDKAGVDGESSETGTDLDAELGIERGRGTSVGTEAATLGV